MSFSHYAPITVDNTKVEGTNNFTDFTGLISGTYDGTGGEPDLRVTGSGGNVTSSSGYDIYFYSDEALTTKLDHQIISYTSTIGEYKARVRIPTLDYNDDTVIYMAYGDSGIVSDPSVTTTWNSAWKRFWPMYESSGTTLVDATGNANLTKLAAGEPAASALGQIHRSQLFDSDDDYAESTNLTGLDLSTGAISYWAYIVDNNENNQLSFSLDNTDNATQSNVYVNHIYRDDTPKDCIQIVNRVDGTTNWVLESTHNGLDSLNNSWVYIVIIQDGTKPTMYFNGSSAGNVDLTTTDTTTWFTDVINATSAADTVAVGSWINNGGHSIGYNDKLSDVSISSYTDANLFKTIYNNESSPSTFYTMGSETEVSAGGSNLKINIAGYTGVRVF